MILLDFLPQLLKTFELRGETAFAGGVDDKDDLAPSLGPKVKRLALLYKERKAWVSCFGFYCVKISVLLTVKRLEIVKCCCGCHFPVWWGDVRYCS